MDAVYRQNSEINYHVGVDVKELKHDDRMTADVPVSSGRVTVSISG